MDNFFLFESKRLYIRGLENEDLERFPQIYHHDSITANLLGSSKLPSSKNIKRAAAEANLNATDGFIFVAFHKESSSYVGSCGLNRISWQNRSAHIGENLEPNYRRQRFGAELCFSVLEYAFRGLNLHRIQSHILICNKPCINMFARLGAQEEGVLREAQYVDGKYSDILAMAILRSEFEACYENSSRLYSRQ